jgi:hypothetical protein
MEQLLYVTIRIWKKYICLKNQCINEGILTGFYLDLLC